MLFYHRGDFFSRDNIERGMITFHPCGFTHGPHPKALAGMFKPRNTETDEYAVMLDTRDALEVGEQELEKLLAVLLRPSLKRQRVREPSGVGVPMRT